MDESRNIDVFENQECPMCSKPTATYSEYEIQDPYAKTIFILSVKCDDCGYKKADLEFEEPGPPAEDVKIMELFSHAIYNAFQFYAVGTKDFEVRTSGNISRTVQYCVVP